MEGLGEEAAIYGSSVYIWTFPRAGQSGYKGIVTCTPASLLYAIRLNFNLAVVYGTHYTGASAGCAHVRVRGSGHFWVTNGGAIIEMNVRCEDQTGGVGECCAKKNAS